MTPAELRADRWAFGPWCWLVGEVRLLSAPIPCRGMQGLWPLAQALSEEEEWRLIELAGGPLSGGLTLLQPYATAIATGPKRVENRPWRRVVPTGGMWVGLHAGKELYANAADLLVEWRFDCHPQNPQAGIWLDAPRLEAFPRGVMLGAMRITDCVRYPAEAGTHQAGLFGGRP